MAPLTTVQQEVLDAQVELLWAVVYQAVEDATDKDHVGTRRRDCDCPWSPTEALQFLRRSFGSDHRITRGVMQARAEGREIHVSVH
jgi:hypothetical protein